MTPLAKILIVTLCAGLQAAIGFSFADDENPSEQAYLIEPQLILTEVGGGSDSSVSPDGKWLAFSSRASGNLDIWVANIETGERRQMTTDPGADNEARWHPDSTHLTFVTQRDGSQDVYTINLATGEETPIAVEPYNEDYPSFRKDGGGLCYTGGPRGYREVMIYDFATGKSRTLTRGYGYVGSTNYSPDGKNIVFHAYYDNSYASGKADLFVVPAAGGKPVNITRDRNTWDYKCNWSWDGDWITFSSKRGTPNFNLFVMHPDGTDVRRLTYVKGPVPLNSAGNLSMSNQNAMDQRWSNWTKDGRIGWHQINIQRGELAVLDVAAGKTTELFESDFVVRDLALSPDGNTLLFENDGDVVILGVESGASPRRLARGTSPRWSSDGAEIKFLSGWRKEVGVISSLNDSEPKISQSAPAQWPPAWPEITSNTASSGGAQQVTVREVNGRTMIGIAIASENSKHRIRDRTAWSADRKRLFFTRNVPASVSYFISKEPVIEEAS